MTPYVIIKAEHSQQLLQHINIQDPYIQFTVEEPSQPGTLPFLDTLDTIDFNHNFHTTVYRKTTHTDLYLHWDSNHFITAKQSVYNTLAHRAKIIITPASNTQGIGSHQKGTSGLPIPPMGFKSTSPKIH